ncbi:MAG: 3-hydroxyacyl-CoA dehydrogenase NAD-binding domain-containing protein [Archaeoglobaceae archaeon]
MKSVDLDRVAVIGAGTMGSDLALLFAISGFDVTVVEISEKARKVLHKKNEETLKELMEREIVKEEPEEILNRIKVEQELRSVKEANFVLEAITEDLYVKRKLFEELEEVFPEDIVFATNTSSYSVTEIADKMRRPERVGGMHFSNPPIFMPLVEVVKGEKTGEETLAFISGIAEKIGKTPIIIKRDKRGFVLNRILSAMMIDGFWAIERAEVTPQELDATIRSIGSPLGIAEGADIIGIDIIYNVFKNFREVYGERFRCPPLIERMVREGKLGKKSGVGFYDWRQGRLEINPELAGKYDISITLALGADEVFRLMEDGIANPETIDRVVELGIMLPYGLCKFADEIGLGFLLETLKRCYEKYKLDLYLPSRMFKEYVSRGWVGRASKRGFYTYEGW